MKKSITFTIALIFATILNAQTAKFFLNKGSVNTITADCSALKNIKVTFPVPANVSSFDEYDFALQLSSLDVPALITFNKADIAKNLTGKTSFTAEILKDDGTSAFSFGDADLKMKDICFLPRIWKMEDVKVDVKGTGFHITGTHSETVWDDNKNAYITTWINEWDGGAKYATGSLTIKQQPLSDGISDATGFVHFAVSSTEKISFGEPEVTNSTTTLSVTDESLGFPVYMTYAVYSATDYPKATLETAMLKTLSGTEAVLFSSRTDDFAFMTSLSVDNRIPCNGKIDKDFQSTTINGIAFDKISYRQDYNFKNNSYNFSLQPGMYFNFYVAQIGNNVVIINSFVSDVISEEYAHMAFGEEPKKEEFDPKWFTTHVQDSDMKNIDDLISKMIAGTTFNVK